MTSLTKYPLRWLVLILCLLATEHIAIAQIDSTQTDSLSQRRYRPSRRPTFRLRDRYADPFSNPVTRSPLFLKDPPNLKLNAEIDSALNYTFSEQIGTLPYRPPMDMSFSQFQRFNDRQLLRDYWQNKSKAANGESAVSSKNLLPKIYISPVLDRIFGGSYVELIPRGFVTLNFGGSFQKINNPSIPIRQQRNGGFEFDQQINMSVVGKVGEKLAVTTNFDNNNSFDFQNNMKVEYTGFKEDVLQKLEIGNVSLPLNNTLIQGAQNLFGIKSQMQFGKLRVTSIVTTQRGKTASINIGGTGQNSGGGQGRPFELIASGYDENRHFFLGHFFRANYQRWIANSPQIISGVNITRVEVYVLNRNNDTQTQRNVVGFMDLGEGSRVYNPAVGDRKPNLPNTNEANDLFKFLESLNRSDSIDLKLAEYGLTGGLDYEKINSARKLNPTEFTIQNQLGYITLTRKLQNDEVLAIAYEYTYNGRSYKVGELSEDYANLKGNEAIFLKLLRPRKIAIRDSNKKIIPTWDLMMKNIYNLNVNQLSRDGFQLRIIYRDDKTGIDNPQLQEGNAVRTRQLIEILGLDKLNPVNDPQRDGNFDFVDGITINTTTGLIIFPYLEPFSYALREAFKGETNESFLIQKYAYDTLYKTTRADAELFATKNKFFIKGTYSAGSSREILIPGFGVSQGSVQVFAGGIPLIDGTDYVADYTFGKITILNEAILNSGKPIEIKYEQQDNFGGQNRSLLGTRLDYRLSDEINFGSTLLYFNERPIVSRNLIGTEPARNVQYGLDFNINRKSRLLTKLIDALPFVQTKEQSSFNITGEFAQLLPGTSNVVDGQGIAYIDDFETTATPYSLMNPTGWKLSSVPKTSAFEFDPSKGAQNDISAGFKRAKIAWYVIDNQFQRTSGRFLPSNITSADMENHYVRGIGPQEIFPNKNLQQGIFFEQTLDIAYYPYERGPYNYSLSLDNNGFLTNPESNWGSITTAIKTEVDFDKANIEYVEFWMMDPFIDGKKGEVIDGTFNKNNTTGGKVIFHLGSLSEDVIRDGKHGFENGLPPNGDLVTGPVARNDWGYVTTQTYLTAGFDNTVASSRDNQDVGMDGLPTDKEITFFQDYLNNLPVTLTPEARQKLEADPSGDNFKYFLESTYDGANAKVLERYKAYNGQDGNTPISSATDIVATASYQNPDNEDLNADNTLSELEEYYEYSLDLRKGNLRTGAKYIVDEILTKEQVKWYLVRIPVREFENKYGNIEGFKSIRYARLLLTGWKEPVVIRMVNFRMVGSRWRRYTSNLRDGGLIPTPEPDAENFSVSVVNLEENSGVDVNSGKSPYKIPPGVVRDRDVTSAVPRQLNEQSIQVCVDGLKDADARAIYKNVAVDLFNYGRIKMFFHGNSADAQSDDLHAFMRVGTDFDQNYYEIEIPLKISPPSLDEPRDVWPEENEIDLALDELYALKVARDREGFSLSESYPRSGPKQVGRHLIRVFGRPDLSSVQVIMIGVKNPKSDDKRTLSVCLWANELRISDFNKKAGWAVNSTVSARLADFAMVTGSFRHTTFGFGSVSSKFAERTRDNTTRYDVSANVNLDKLLPGNTGIKLPMFVSYERTYADPQYDPANPDIKINALLKSYDPDDPEAQIKKSEYLKTIRDETIRRSINFSNVRKTKRKQDAKTHIWDPENLAFSYSWSEANRTNFNTAQSFQRQVKGSVAYQFAPKSTGFEPFKNSKTLGSPWLKFIKDFNFNPMPSNLTVRLDLDRSFGKTIYRNSNGAGGFQESDPNYLKYFTINRTYNLRWSLTKNLTIDYASRVNAIVDEPTGDIDTQAKKDSILYNLKRFGRMKSFDQTFTVNYTLPLDKLPITDWLGADYRYEVGYNWKAGAINLPDTLNFRNTIQNSRDQNYSGRIDLVKLYNKVKFLKELNTPPKPVITKINPKGKTAPPKVEQDTTQKFMMPAVVKSFFRLLMSVRSINGTYAKTEGTILPGFSATPWLFGINRDQTSPSTGFIFGDQNPAIRFNAARNGALIQNNRLTSLFSQVRNENLNLRANIEPFPDFKIQLDVKKETTASYQEIFRYDPTQPEADPITGYASLSPSRTGSYRISTLTLNTAFDKSNRDVNSTVFKNFEENLNVIRERFQLINGSDYDTTSQDVLIPAFIAAYTGKNARTTSLSPFMNSMLPNWRLDYAGLGKLGVFKNLFQSVTITHAYSSVYSVTNYSNSLEYGDTKTLAIDRPVEDYNRRYFGTNIDGKLVPVYIISQVMISEQFNPLIGINVRTKSRVTANLQYKTKRDLALNISNAQVTEQTSNDFSFELGFTKNNMKLPFKAQGRTIVLKNDVTFRMNTTIGNTRTIQRKIEELNTITNGNINFQLRPNVSYTVNQKLTVQIYFERNINEPLISNSARRATTRFGTQIRFSLAQ